MNQYCTFTSQKNSLVAKCFMWLPNMKLLLGILLLLILYSAYVKSEKVRGIMTAEDKDNDESDDISASPKAVSSADEIPDASNETIMKKLQKLPTDKLQNILKIINRQNEDETEPSTVELSSDSHEEDEKPKEETSIKSEENPRKISFHRNSRFKEQAENVGDGQDSEISSEQESHENNVENDLKTSPEKTKTGSLRGLRKFEPVTNVLIHAFEGDMNEEADKGISTGLRGAARGENIAKLTRSDGRDIDTGSNDVFADTEEKINQGKHGFLQTPASRLKLARLAPKLQKFADETDDQSSRGKEGIEREMLKRPEEGRSRGEGSVLESMPQKSINANNEGPNYLKPIKLRPLQADRIPYKNVVNEKLPAKIIQEINQAMIDRVNDSGDRRKSNQGSAGENPGDSDANTATMDITSGLQNASLGEADKRASTKSQFAFSYDPDSPIGPEMWKVLHTDWTCQGRKQSPINIKTDNIANDTICKNIVIRVEPEGRPISGILRNNGHAPTFSLTNSATVRLMGATLPNVYHLKQLHFHFGCENSRGSEHKIDGQSYPMELHLVFWDKTTFDSFAQAAKSDRGIAVVAVLFQRSFVPVSQVRNTPVTQLLQVLKKIPNEGDFVQISEIFDFRLEKLIPNVMNKQEADRFFTYEGSLTTPGCYESVTWIVLNSHPVVTDDQLEMFRKLKSAKVNSDGTMCDNYRPIQKNYGRRIYSNII